MKKVDWAGIVVASSDTISTGWPAHEGKQGQGLSNSASKVCYAYQRMASFRFSITPPTCEPGELFELGEERARDGIGQEHVQHTKGVQLS